MQNCSAFYRPLRGLSVERQRQTCAAAAARLNLTISNEYSATDDDAARDEWIKQLERRPRDAAIVAKLEVIGETRQTTKSPTADFAAAIMAVAMAADFVVEADSGVTSRDGKSWRDLVKHAASVVSAGRAMSKRVAQNRAAKRWAKALPGVVERWQHKSKAAERKRWAQHWRDAAFANEHMAFEAFPEPLQQELGSSSTARRIFGKRKPGSKSAGGRPPAKRKT
jgi:hypothetical protein